jgi:TetR/AcrR family transcriptional repressor of mexJK operon
MIVTNEVQDLKKEKILDAAYQRFIHYGYSKTTMNEIAGDLCMSKALLYYYFPDKSQLYVDVMKKLAEDYVARIFSRQHTFGSLCEAFEFQIDCQHDFFLKNYNFFDSLRINEQQLPDKIWDIVTYVHQAEVDMLVNEIDNEVKKGTMAPLENACEIVRLLLDALHGVRVGGSKSQKKAMFPDKEHLDEIHKKRLLMSEIFIRGLKR